MAIFVWTNARLFVNELDVSGQTNRLQLDYTAEMLDDTAMQVATIGTRNHVAGLWDVALNHRFFDDFATPGPPNGIGDFMFPLVGAASFNHTIIPRATGAAGVIADGDKALFGQFTSVNWSPGGTVGEVAAVDYEAQSTEQLAIGRVSIDDATNVTGVVSGSIYEFGNVATFPGFGGNIDAGDRVVAMIHIIAADSVSDLDFALESDTLVGFSSPTVLATSLNHTGVGTAFLQSDGTEITDDFFRLNVTSFTGTSATVLGVVGVVRGR